MKTDISFKELYSFDGFQAQARLKAYPCHAGAYMASLKRSQKKLYASAGKHADPGTTAILEWFETWTQEECRYTWSSKCAG